MLTPLTLDGRSLSQTSRVADLRGTDLVPLVRPSEPLPADQNVTIRADRLQALLGTGSVIPGPAITLYDTLGIHTDGAATQRLVNEVADAAVRVPNLRPAGHAVTADFVTTPGWGTGSSSLSDLLVDTLFIGTTAIAIFSVGGRFRTYVLADDPQGPLSVWRDGRMSGTRVLAGWVLSDAPQAVATAYASIDGTSYVWGLRQFASAYVGTPLTIQFFQARTAAVHPAPTEGGDVTHWEAISPQSVVAASTARLYTAPGQNTDGAMTQQATTNALAAKADLNALGTLTLAQRPLATTAEVGAVRIGRGLRITTAGVLLNNAIDYAGETDVATVGTIGTASSSNTVSGGSVSLTDYTQSSAITQALVLGQLIGFRSTTAAVTTLDVGQLGGTIAGVRTLAMSGFEFVWLRITAVGYDIVLRGNTAPPFTAITANQYGTHPAFSSQTALNAYLLGGTYTAPAPTLTTATFTAA